MTAEWDKTRRQNHPDSLREWVSQFYGPFQSIGLNLMEQATLFHSAGDTLLAAAKFDTARAIGEALAEAVKDSFLLQQVDRIIKLDAKSLRWRAQAAALYAEVCDLARASQYDDARKTCIRLGELAERAKDDKLYIDSQRFLLYILDRDNNHQEVITLGDKIIEKAKQIGYRRRLAITLYQIAGAYSKLDQDSLALTILAQALPIAERLRDRQVLAYIYNCRARAFFKRRTYQLAEAALQNVIVYDDAKIFGGHVHLLRGDIAYLRGEYGRAQTQYELALKLFQQNADRANEATTLYDLSGLNILIGDYEYALQLEKTALTLREAEDNSEKMAESFSRLGFIYLNMDSLDQAIAVCQQSLALFRSGYRSVAANAWLILGDAQLKKNDLLAASRAFARAEEIANTSDNQLVKVEARLGQGQISLRKGQAETAKKIFAAALARAQSIDEPSLAADAWFGLAQAEQKLSHFENAATSIAQAIAEIENMRSGIAQDTMRVSYFSTTQKLFDYAISLALARDDTRLALQYAERARARALLDAFSKAAITDIPEEQIARVSAPVSNFQQLQSRIPASAQIVEYRLTPDTLVMWLIDRSKLITRRIAFSDQAIAQIIQVFRRSLGADALDAFQTRVTQQGIKNVYEENRRLGRRLGQLIWDPIADAIAPNKMLYIVPDGALHHLPFGALVTEDGRFWEERYLWMKAPSLSILSENSNWQLPMNDPKQVRFVMIAGDLPSINAQTKFLGRLFPRADILTKHDATYAALQERLRESADIVYFSVHAVADERYPMNSYIELFDDSAVNHDLQTTKVYARQLLSLAFSKTSLAVLNACETSIGKIAAGEGVLNLVRVFTLAQVPAIIASLWKNDDRLSALITNHCFQSIASGKEYALSLHQAKLFAIQKLQNDYQFALPYFWSAFELYQNKWAEQAQLKFD